MPNSRQDPVQGYHITFNYHISLDSGWLYQFLRFFFFFNVFDAFDRFEEFW